MSDQITNIGPERLVESKTNPRKAYGEDLKELAKSIAEQGIIAPLVVRTFEQKGVSADNQKYEIVVGSRRFRAAKMLDLAAVPCIIRNMQDHEALELQITENLQRADVHPMEEAEGIESLGKSLSQDEIATRIGKSLSYVYQRLKLLSLVAPARKAFVEGKISAGHAVQIARLTEPQQKDVITRILNDRHDETSVRELARYIQDNFHLRLNQAPFNTNDATLVKAAGSCTVCPKRTGANRLLFGEGEKDDTCTDPTCYATKVNAFIEITLKENPEARKLSTGRHYSDHTWQGLTPDKWSPAGKAKCESTVEGIVVQGDGREQYGEKKGLGVGSMLKVCTDPKCKVHHEQVDHGYQHTMGRSGGKKSAAEKTAAKSRRENWKLDQAVHQVVVANWRKTEPTADDLRRTVDELVEDYQFGHKAVMIARGFGHTQFKGESDWQIRKDATAKVKSLMAKAPLGDLLTFLAAYSITPDYENDATLRRVIRQRAGAKAVAAAKTNLALELERAKVAKAAAKMLAKKSKVQSKPAPKAKTKPTKAVAKAKRKKAA